MPPVLEREPESAAVSANGVSQNDAKPVVKKTNLEMLAEMMDYWSKGNVEAVEDLSGFLTTKPCPHRWRGLRIFTITETETPTESRKEPGLPFTGKPVLLWTMDERRTPGGRNLAENV